jgi:hypothetical protein
LGDFTGMLSTPGVGIIEESKSEQQKQLINKFKNKNKGPSGNALADLKLA